MLLFRPPRQRGLEGKSMKRFPIINRTERAGADQGGITAEAVCQLGKPAEEIMKVAANHHADLIVMGA